MRSYKHLTDADFDLVEEFELVMSREYENHQYSIEKMAHTLDLDERVIKSRIEYFKRYHQIKVFEEMRDTEEKSILHQEMVEALLASFNKGEGYLVDREKSALEMAKRALIKTLYNRKIMEK